MAKGPVRWNEVTPSQFSHETEGLSLVRALLPQLDPFRAWSNFEFRDSHGRWHEVDLLVLGQRRLHLVELKYYSGVLRGNDHTWLRDGHRAEDSPLKLTRRKAQRLATTLQEGLLDWARERGTRIPDVRAAVPYIQESVFLHHPGMRCELPLNSRADLFGQDGFSQQSGLPGISERLLEPSVPGQAVPPHRAEIIAEVMKRLGMHRRQREAGSWIIDDEPLGEDDEWQDWPAFHRVATTSRARIRFLTTPAGAAAARRARLRRIAEHEYRIMSRLAHENLLRPIDIVDSELGVGLVYPRDERFQRLDLWLAGQGDAIAVADQLAIIRQVADAVLYAHSNRVVHRALSPNAVWVRRREGDDEIRVLVGDWQTSGSTGADSLTGSSGGVTGLFGTGEQSRPSGGTALGQPRPADAGARLAEAFQAPEGAFTDHADRIRIDVFALGALGYYLLAGRPPAASRAGLRDRLRRENGLDLAADLPQVTAAARELILESTRPQVTERVPDVRTFLAKLDQAEQALQAPDADEITDLLEAPPGAVIEGRYRIERRLGRGSTAVGLLVTDLMPGPAGTETQPAQHVLKVALDDTAASRLAGEAEVLASLDDPHIVRLVAGPERIGGRTVLVLERAGEQTLAEVLRERERLSLDMQERYGTDLLEALVVLDRAGIDHRDIKPSNLGVREDRSSRAKHLVLFDFSLSRAGATAVTAGTQNYLDPFLDDPGRGRFDSAAERYSAAVVLFEMATGSLPRFGDGLSDPASLRDEATIETDMFAPAVEDQLTDFFRRALAREATVRFDTAADMLAAWQAAFVPVGRSLPEDAERSAAGAKLETPLTQAGLSARALSALEPFGVQTVADLLAVRPARLTRMSGVADITRREIRSRTTQWRALMTEPAAASPATTAGVAGVMPDPVRAATTLVERGGSQRAQGRRQLAELLLGLNERARPFATIPDLSAILAVTQQRVAREISLLQEAWTGDAGSRTLLDGIGGLVTQALADLDGIATVAELTGAILAALAPVPADRAQDTERVAAGLLRVALDRVSAASEAGDGAPSPAVRREGSRIVLLATGQELLDPAEVLGRTADELVARAQAASERLVQAQRAVPYLQAAWRRSAGSGPDAPAPPGQDRLLRLAAALSQTAALSGSRDLHPRDLDIRLALRDTLTGAASLQELPVREIKDRFRVRFPALPPLPDRPRLDELLDEAGLGLRYDEQAHAFRQPSRAGDTSRFSSRAPTTLGDGRVAPVTGDQEWHRLAESARSRSFLALGVQPRLHARIAAGMADQFGAVELDVTALLIEAMRAQASAVGLSWDLVKAADAAPAGSRDAQGLAALVERSLPALDAAIDEALAQAPEGTRPVVLTDAATLARYGHLTMIAPRADLATRRPQAIWIMVPQLDGNRGPLLDGRPIPLAAPGQFLKLDGDWLNSPAAKTPAGGTA